MVSLCAGTSKSAETQGSSQRKDAETREWAVVCAASTFDFGTGEIDPHKAAILFRSRHGGGVHKRVKERHSVFIERHYKNFREFGCIADAHRSGRPVIISEEDALAASKILKAGHWVTEKIKGLPGATYEELIYFTACTSKLLEKRQTSGNHEREQLQQHGDQVTCCGRQQCQQPQGILLLLMLFTFLKSAAVMLAPNMRKWSMHGTSLDGTCSAQICMSTLARLRSRTQYSTSRRAAYLTCARRGVQKQPLSHKPSCSCRVCQCCFLAPCSMDVDKAAGEWS
jgi:hypothetical protein